ncbi:hypothetical protein N0V88_001803 [Collariella sp. IMI 366227]|nr:hypothetical protein N0V88_001803 [Collariella sp. IMI 366227]
MAPKHDRQYDLVVFGATGYTGKYTAQYITTHLPTDLRWAVAGRSQSTGEVPFVHAMLQQHSSTASTTGALMFPQIGIESAPPDLLTFALTQHIHTNHSLPTRDVTLSIHTLKSAPSGGTLSTVFSILDNFPLRALRAAYAPYALSPLPHPPQSTPSTPGSPASPA